MEITTWVYSADADDFWLLAGVLAVICAVSLFQGFMFLIRKRIIEDIPTSRVRSAAQGYVELEGRCELMDGPPILAPLTGSHCAWYQYAVQERRGSGKNRRWVTVESGRSSELFLLVEDTGQCVIDPDGARVTASANQTWYGATRDSRPLATGRRWFSFGGRYKFRESRLHAGDSLYAIGLFETIGGPGSGANHQTLLREILREWKTDTEMLLRRFDENSDGEIGLEEWEQVRAAAWQEVLKHHGELQQAEPVHILSTTHDARRPFLLSAVPQFDLVSRYQAFMICLFTLALFTGAACSWLITTRLAAPA
ncbi:MAG: GIDE domain-containing protein [Gammaproteobacteria bacterium]|nr:GIDE domain-containing protein [Gammaproteobacteria bacterium]